MSADNGFIIRKNKNYKFVLQEYCASADALPSINNPRIPPFDSLHDAVIAYSKIANNEGTYIVEYGLNIDIEKITES